MYEDLIAPMVYRPLPERANASDQPNSQPANSFDSRDLAIQQIPELMGVK